MSLAAATAATAATAPAASDSRGGSSTTTKQIVVRVDKRSTSSFNSPGAYDLGLQATDSGGEVDTVRKQIGVRAADSEPSDADEDKDKDADEDEDQDGDKDQDEDEDEDEDQDADTPPAPSDHPAARRLRLMSPFPVVRIAGSVLPRGALVRILSVRAPRGSHVRVTCAGRGCPPGSVATTSATTRVVRFRKYERRLPAGIRLRLLVRQKQRIGKYTSFLIRAGAPPKRVDRCLFPGRGPRHCP